MEELIGIAQSLVQGLIAGTLMSVIGVTILTLACLELPLHTMKKPKDKDILAWIIWGILSLPLFIMREFYKVNYLVGSLIINGLVMYALTLVMGSSHQAGSINMAAHAIATVLHGIRYYYYRKLQEKKA
jgi:Na+/melibiose symporter-like transporter